jgi:hypothetical protein
MRKVIFILLALSFLCVQTATAANLVVNGSFENTTGFVPDIYDTMSLSPPSTTMNGWTVINAELAWIGPSNPWFLSASQGSYFLDLTGYQNASPYGGVEQTISLAPGNYRLSFDLGSSVYWQIPSKITATAGSTTQTFTSTNTSSNNAWETFTMDFTATGSTTISLVGDFAAYAYIGLDNVSVTAPLPATTWLLGSGLLGLLGWRYRKS